MTPTHTCVSRGGVDHELVFIYMCFHEHCCVGRKACFVYGHKLWASCLTNIRFTQHKT